MRRTLFSTRESAFRFAFNEPPAECGNTGPIVAQGCYRNHEQKLKMKFLRGEHANFIDAPSGA